MIIEENIKLDSYTTFRIGGKAKFFCIVKNEKDLKEAYDFALNKKIPHFILGGGSNILIDDLGFPGLIIKIEIKGKEILKDIVGTTIRAGAGENWDDFVKFTLDNELYGLENLSLIPGTVGASAVQNIGAYGVEVKEYIHSVRVFDGHTFRYLSNKDCAFDYRDSIFKKDNGKNLVVVEVIFKLNPNPKVRIDYKDLVIYFSNFGKKNSKEKINPVMVRDAVIEIRRSKLPDLSLFGTAGSFFKNIVISQEKYHKLLEKFPNIPGFKDQSNNIKISTAWILDNICGFKGYRINQDKEEDKNGQFGVYENQALVLVYYFQNNKQSIPNNPGQAIRFLAKKMSDCVREKTGIELEREVVYLP